jgi:hypothetical protein
MIVNLVSKASNPKYYQCIVCFSHILNGRQRQDFIKQVASINLQLACKLLRSCEDDAILASYFTSLAIERSSSIYIENKAIGYLCLIELQKFDLLFSILPKKGSITLELRKAILRVSNELAPDNLIKFLKIIISTKTKPLINGLLTTISKRGIKFSATQKIEVEEFLPEIRKIYSPECEYQFCKFMLVFDLSNKLIPKNLNSIIQIEIKKGNTDFFRQFCIKYDIPFPFSEIEICKILLRKNNESCALKFGEILFNLSDHNDKARLLELALIQGGYFEAFVYSLIKSRDSRNEAILSSPDILTIRKLIGSFENRDSLSFDQNILLQITRKVNKSETRIIGKYVECIVTNVIEKTIFVCVLQEKLQGSIWIKEYANSYIRDAREIVKVGNKFEAIIIGIGQEKIELSVKKM